MLNTNTVGIVEHEHGRQSLGWTTEIGTGDSAYLHSWHRRGGNQIECRQPVTHEPVPSGLNVRKRPLQAGISSRATAVG